MMLIDYHHPFVYHAAVPWPRFDGDPQIDWTKGIAEIEYWLINHIGQRFQTWAWSDSHSGGKIGVGFRWDQHRSLFILTWS